MLQVRQLNSRSLELRTNTGLGKVPHHPKPVPTETVDIGNGDEAPEWGVELELHGGPGLITYGPWADRQRYAVVCVAGRCSNSSNVQSALAANASSCHIPEYAAD